MIFGSNESRYWDIRKILALLALVAAIVAAQGAGNIIAYIGIGYYVVCIIAILLRFRWAGGMLWLAVGAHVLLTGWALWNWYTELIIPCHYCLWAAGFVLLAATAFYRLPAAVLPVLLMVAVSAAWPYAFGDKVLDEINPSAGEATIEPVSAPGDNQPGEEDDTLPAGENPAMGLPAGPEGSGSNLHNLPIRPAQPSPPGKPAPVGGPPVPFKRQRNAVRPANSPDQPVNHYLFAPATTRAPEDATRFRPGLESRPGSRRIIRG